MLTDEQYASVYERAQELYAAQHYLVMSTDTCYAVGQQVAPDWAFTDADKRMGSLRWRVICETTADEWRTQCSSVCSMSRDDPRLRYHFTHFYRVEVMD